MSSKSDILRYWRAIECFLPQKAPEFKPNDQLEPVFKIAEGDLAPWDKQHKILGKIAHNQKLRIRHTLYGGIYPIAKVRENMEATFGKDPDTFDERNGGETCLFSIQLTQDGRPLFDSFVLSMCAWALGRLKDPGPEKKTWLDGFETKMESLKKDFEQRFAVQKEDEEGLKLVNQGFNVGRALAISEILACAQEIQETLKIEHLEVNAKQFLVKSVVVHEKNVFKVEDSDFLNSFFVKDLDNVATKAASGKLSKALSEYLEDEINTRSRVDVRKLDLKEKLTHLSPSAYPKGCWPTKGFFPLVYAQQFAVNTIMGNLGSQAGIFSVNGPPGTGKTTLLRDLIAAVIVERAVNLSELSDPMAAFEGEEKWKSDSNTREMMIWKETFHGYEMVVASSNNSAVENVTLEIPALEAIDQNYLEAVSYFSDIATEILNKDCWALLAAKLGNKSNRTSFKDKFWAYPDFSSKKETEKKEPEKPSFYKYLLKCQPSITRWKMAVEKFKSALAWENELRQARQTLYEKYKVSIENANDFSAVCAKLAQVKNELSSCFEKMNAAQRLLEKEAEKRQEAIERRLEHRQFKPALTEIIFSLGKAYATWHAQDLVYQGKIFAIEKECDTTSHGLAHHQHNANQLQEKIIELEKLKDTWLKNQQDIDLGQKTYGKYFPTISLLEDETTCELSSPWMDEHWFQARVNVFLEALNLHQAFIEVNAPVFQKNLQGMVDILSGKGQNAAPSKAIRSAWTTFFFVVPVVSTTFASFDRLFPHFEHESLGWLFIDEAGQATPQAAVGALWRTRRAVVVGDPLQLEPILTLPITAQEALRKHFSVQETWLPKRCSVQTLGDRVNKYGTYLKNENAKDFWVGAPLRVHRRCENPMFDISNNVAYDGMMVFATPPRSSLPIENSCWFHVEGQVGEGHWIEAEGVRVQQLISALLSKGFPEKEIAIISPFTVVVNQLKYRFPRTKFSLTVGTIHTMQGKEADVVILVLGGDPNKPGAKDWAAEKPNLLNVAVSRAKKRLFVVGDKVVWGSRPYFRTLAQLL